MGYLDFPIIDLIKTLTPPFLRTGSVVKYTESLVFPIQFLADRDDKTFDLEVTRSNYNGGKLLMQTVLNIELALPNNTIVVVTVDDSGVGFYVGNEVETPDKFFGNKLESGTEYIANESETSVPVGHDFKIQVPTAHNTTDNIALINHLTKRMKVAGRNYIIEIV